jgi:hypothetical protein
VTCTNFREIISAKLLGGNSLPNQQNGEQEPRQEKNEFKEQKYYKETVDFKTTNNF